MKRGVCFSLCLPLPRELLRWTCLCYPRECLVQRGAALCLLRGEAPSNSYTCAPEPELPTSGATCMGKSIAPRRCELGKCFTRKE